jgi:DNA invertase Pin-like site-specific DNA recombinase
MATDTITRVAVYTRVSTDKQETENQAIQLREFAEKQRWHIVREYCDYESGSKCDRISFKRMFEDASKHKFDRVLFWSLDRLSREGAYETLTYLNRLSSCGVGWRSYTEQYLDSTGIFREAVISILAVIAKQERVRLSERTKAGLAVARSKGRFPGRPRLRVDPSEIVRLRSSGLSLRAIGRRLRISEGSVRRYASAP